MIQSDRIRLNPTHEYHPQRKLERSERPAIGCPQGGGGARQQIARDQRDQFLQSLFSSNRLQSMNITRNGKIARLPRAVRQELNRRLGEGEQGKKLVTWLNALPEVQAVVAAEFGGRPVREQNLSEWKQGGYRDWVLQQEALEMAERLGEDAAEWDTKGRPPVTETLARWVAGRYTLATRMVAETGGAQGWGLLRELCSDIVALRRGEHSAARLQLDRERVELERERTDRRMREQFEDWLKQPEMQQRLCGKKELSMEEREQRIPEIFGLPAKGSGGITAETLAEIEGR